MTITPGSFVTRRGGDGTQMLVTMMIGTIADCQWWTDDHELHVERIESAELHLQVPGNKRARFVEDRAQADIELAKAEKEREIATGKAEHAAAEEARAAAQARKADREAA